MRCLIFCAGNGTRLRPLTDTIPKPMIKVAGKPVLEHLVDHLESYGISEVIVNLHYKPEPIYKYFGTRLLYSYEPELLGEAGTEISLRHWLGELEEKYIIMNGDTLTNIDINEMRKYDSVYSWDGVWTGIAIKRRWDEIKKKVDFNCYWQDVGTFTGLKKAREHYEKK